MATDYSKIVRECLKEIFNPDVGKEHKNNGCIQSLINDDIFDQCGTQYISSIDHQIAAIKTSSHLGRRELEEATRTCNKELIVENHINITLHWFFEDMAKNFASSDLIYPKGKLNILILDDHYNYIENRIGKIIDIIKYKSRSNESECMTINVFHNTGKDLQDWIESLNKNQQDLALKTYRYIFCDLLIGDELIGLDIINRLAELRQYYSDYRYEIIALSRSTNTEDIQKALNFGASLYIPKERIFSIPHRLANLGTELPVISSERNTFNSLLKLPATSIKKLQTDVIHDTLEDRNWIHKLPKADIHTHLGGYMDAEITLKMSVYNTLMALTTLFKEGRFSFYKDEYNGKTLLDNLIKVKNEGKGSDGHSDTFFDLENLLNKIFKMSERYCEHATKLNKKSLVSEEEEQGCDDDNNIKNIRAEPLAVFSPESFCEQMANDPQYQLYELKPYLVTSMFNVALSVCESTPSSNDQSECSTSEEPGSSDHFKNILKRFQITDEVQNGKSPNQLNSKLISLSQNKEEQLEIILPTKKDRCETLNRLITATHGNELKRARGGITLNAFLKGCDYTGSDVMQSRYTIARTIKYICEKAYHDHVTLLELRVTPTNLSRGGLSPEEIWFAFTKGYELFIQSITEGSSGQQKDWSVFKRRPFFLTFVIALKRHYKDQSAIEENIKFGTEHNYYNVQKKKKEARKSESTEADLLSYPGPFVAGFDLTGQEQRFNPKEFRAKFKGVFEACMPITIHAGEETESQYIWDAAYELNADRIGHGLSLAHPDAQDLLNRFKDFNKCVEMCPTSNFLTQKDIPYYPEFNGSGLKYSRKLNDTPTENSVTQKGGTLQTNFGENYPTGTFLEENISFTICTDDPAIQGTTLTDEYIWASMLTRREESFGITKWEALQIIRNGFKYAFLPAELKTDLLMRIDNNVYDIIKNSEI